MRTSINADHEKLTYAGFDPNEVKSECRYRLFKTMKSLIWERYEKGHTGAESTRLLDNTVNIALDTPSIKIPLWENTYDYFTQFSLLKFFFKLKDTLFIGKYARA